MRSQREAPVRCAQLSVTNSSLLVFVSAQSSHLLKFTNRFRHAFSNARLTLNGCDVLFSPEFFCGLPQLRRSPCGPCAFQQSNCHSTNNLIKACKFILNSLNVQVAKVNRVPTNVQVVRYSAASSCFVGTVWHSTAVTVNRLEPPD